MLKAVLMTSRPPFLVLAFTCMSLVVATGLWLGGTATTAFVVAMLLLLFLAHVSVNALNEAEDFRSGLDLKTIKTPFSGGSGTLPNKPEAVNAAYAFGLAALLLAVFIGLWLAVKTDWYLLLLGLLGVVIILAYTKWINRMPWLCLIAPGLGLAVIPVFGGAWVLTGHAEADALLISFIPALLINNLLLLNQFPDLEADQSVGRRTLPVAYGRRFSAFVYLLNWLLALILLLVLIALQKLPLLAFAAVVSMLPGLIAARAAFACGDKLHEQTAFLAANVACAVLSPLVLALAMYVSR
ncbi:prenyltransferase [Agaribacterium haliotis]|uniref:prenyltransferase n=1 Tax=Agaribacterium haliotis TaxID=2013869 RepID=UPI000BB553F2|nr:prenyltransferase [Agaribacterium haliotis]